MIDDAIARYREERLPRYTSYPTAPQFSREIGPADYAHWLEALKPDAIGSLYLHVPFCRSMCWYCGCHTTITRHDKPVADYARVLEQEIGLVADRMSHRLAVRHIHFGGGTPTILKPEDFARLVDTVRARFDVAGDAEIAIEIDPRTLTREMTRTLGASGVTRASLGVQTFDLRVQQAIHRFQSAAQTARAAEGLREAGVKAINFDLIYGLPHQTVASCLDTVRDCIEMRPDRLAVFGYAHIPSFKKHQGVVNVEDLPNGPARHDQAEAIGAALEAAGYCRIGLDHYALPHDEMVLAQTAGRLRRNFQGYTTDTADALIGLGASSIGRLPDGYVQNDVGLLTYAERIQRGELATIKGYRLTAEDRLRADLIERIMCDFGVDVGEVCGRHDASSRDLLAASPRLPTLEADGLVRRDGDSLTIAPDARHLVRSVAAAFDAHLGKAGPVHSRAI